MISTLLNYRRYTNDLTQTLERVSDQASIAKNAEYYRDKIGGVTSVDEFLDDDRLYSYAMKAYGLEDQIGSKGLMRKVLESDLTKTDSFANKLVDKRYRDFASAFDFASASKTPLAQSTAQNDRLIEAYGERVDRTAVAAAAKTGYYASAIAGITSVDQFVGDAGLLDVALRSVGIVEPSRIDPAYVKGVLTGGITSTSTAFVSLKAQFGFDRNPVPTPPQTPAQTEALVYNYNVAIDNTRSPQAAQADLDYYDQKVTGSRNSQAIAGDKRLTDLMLTSVGFDLTSFDASYIASILESDPAGATSALNALPESTSGEVATKAKWRELNARFSRASDADGNVVLTQSEENRTKTTDGYLANYKSRVAADDNRASVTFTTALESIRSVRDLMARSEDSSGLETGSRSTLEYVLKAFDLDPATESLSKIRAVLTSDPSDPDSYVSKLKDERYSNLAAAFNFGSDGKLRAERLVQSVAKQTKTATLYSATFGTDQTASRKELVKGQTQTYLEAVGAITSLDGFIADKKVVAYALTAYGVKNTDISAADLRKIMTSDLGDPESFANTQADKAIAKFAAAFNFEPDGSIADAGAGVQAGAARLATDNLYVLQTLEEQAGETSEGTRLALYFLRKAPDITSVYGILSDAALFQVVRTALGLPDGMSSGEIEAQARTLEKRLDVADFSDPAKLDKFIARFAGMYDLTTDDPSSSSPILALFNGGDTSAGGGILSFL